MRNRVDDAFELRAVLDAVAVLPAHELDAPHAQVAERAVDLVECAGVFGVNVGVAHDEIGEFAHGRCDDVVVLAHAVLRERNDAHAFDAVGTELLDHLRGAVVVTAARLAEVGMEVVFLHLFTSRYVHDVDGVLVLVAAVGVLGELYGPHARIVGDALLVDHGARLLVDEEVATQLA